jgi:hypothetical protein
MEGKNDNKHQDLHGSLLKYKVLELSQILRIRKQNPFQPGSKSESISYWGAMQADEF